MKNNLMVEFTGSLKARAFSDLFDHVLMEKWRRRNAGSNGWIFQKSKRHLFATFSHYYFARQPKMHDRIIMAELHPSPFSLFPDRQQIKKHSNGD